MEITVLSNSQIADAREYTRSRLLRWRILALWALLVATRLIAAPLPDPESVATPALFLALALVVLRLWDDLADLEYDRSRHPQRMLVRSDNLSMFVAVVVLGLLLMGGAQADDSRRLAVYVALLVWLALLYHSSLGIRVPRTARAVLVLIKYPVLVYLAGADPSRRAGLAALFLYLALLMYEWRDDPEMRAAPRQQILLGGGLGLVLVIGLFLAGSNS